MDDIAHITLLLYKLYTLGDSMSRNVVYLYQYDCHTSVKWGCLEWISTVMICFFADRFLVNLHDYYTL